MDSNSENQKPVRLKDFNNTIILIGKNEDPETAIKKYMNSLRDYKYSNMKDLTKDKKIK